MGKVSYFPLGYALCQYPSGSLGGPVWQQTRVGMGDGCLGEYLPWLRRWYSRVLWPVCWEASTPFSGPFLLGMAEAPTYPHSNLESVSTCTFLEPEAGPVASGLQRRDGYRFGHCSSHSNSIDAESGRKRTLAMLSVRPFSWPCSGPTRAARDRARSISPAGPADSWHSATRISGSLRLATVWSTMYSTLSFSGSFPTSSRCALRHAPKQLDRYGALDSRHLRDASGALISIGW